MKDLCLGHDVDGSLVNVSVGELATHLLVVGATGRGKTVFLNRLIERLMGKHGMFVLAPHADMAEFLVTGLAAQNVTRRVHLIEPGNPRYTTGFNPLAFPREHLAAGVEGVVQAFSAAWGHEDLHERPRLRRTLTAMLYLLAARQLSLADAVPLFAPDAKGLRARLAEEIPDEFFRNEWQEFNGMADKERREFFESSLNRLAPLVANDCIRAMLGQTDRVLDFRRAMDNGEIIIANLSRSPSFTESDAQVVGTLLLNAIAQSALLRNGKKPRPFYVLIDEAYRFLSRDCETLLDQTRKMGVHLVLALQRLGQTAEKGEALSSVVRSIQSKVVFGGLAVPDAMELADELFLGEYDLQETKSRITTPVTVGYKKEWLDSESEAETESDQWSDTEGEGEDEGGSISKEKNTETGEESPTIGMGSSARKSRNCSRTVGGGTSRGATRGQHEARVPILQERATHTYSVEEHRLRRAVMLKELPVGTAAIKIRDRRAVTTRVPKPKPKKRKHVARTRIFRAQLHAGSPSAMRTDEALLAISTRQRALLNPPISADSTTYGRHTKKQQKQTKKKENEEGSS